MAAITQLTPGAWGGQRYGAFSGRAPAKPTTALTQLSLGAWGAMRYGSFAGRTPVPPARTQGDGGEYLKRKKTRKREAVNYAELDEAQRFRLEIEVIYNELHGIRKQGQIEKAVKEIVAPFKARPTRWLPPASQIDFDALAQDVAAARKLIDLYEQSVIDDEETFFLLMYQ